MIDSQLDSTDYRLLNLIQIEFPLTEKPHADLGLQLGLSSDEVLHRIERFKTAGIIRLIGPVLNAGKLGYQTTLVGTKIAREQMNNADRIIGMHQRVSHCYERDHELNFWFTLAIPANDDMNGELNELSSKMNAEVIFNLPAVNVFKIGAYFNIGGHDSPVPTGHVHNTSIFNKVTDLSPTDRAVVNELQQDLPLTAKPFDFMSTHLSMDVDKFLTHCQSLMQRGIMRRFSASINHNRVGFVANAMTCWRVPQKMVETAGRKMATFKEISHCYERQTSPLWSYNMYAMIHASSKEACKIIAEKVSSEADLDRSDFALLFSTREVKKTRVRYLV